MSSVFRLKRRSSGSASGAPSSLFDSEPAYNHSDDILYLGEGFGGEGGTATLVKAIAGKGAFLSLFGSQTVTGDKIFTRPVAVADPTDDSHAVNRGFVLQQISESSPNITAGAGILFVNDVLSVDVTTIPGFDSAVRASRLDQFAVPTNSVNFNNQRLVNVAGPQSASDAATKQYVDTLYSRLDFKEPVAAVESTGGVLSGIRNVDGVPGQDGLRILVINQVNPANNGIFLMHSGSWTRAADDISNGAFVFALGGTFHASVGFLMTTPDPITVGVTSQTWSIFTKIVTTFMAGDGIDADALISNVLSVKVTEESLAFDETGALAISTDWSGQPSISIVGTITTGVWNGSVIGVQYGGTGASTVPGARSSLGLGSMALQEKSSVDITGGTIEGVVIDCGTF